MAYGYVVFFKKYLLLSFSCLVVSDSATPWTTVGQAFLSFTISQNLLKLISCSNSFLAQTHVHWVSDAIQPSHALSFPSPPPFNLSQHQGRLFTLAGQSIGASASASVFPMKIQGWFPLGLTGLISLQSKGLSRVSSNTALVGSKQRRNTPTSPWEFHHCLPLA